MALWTPYTPESPLDLTKIKSGTDMSVKQLSDMSVNQFSDVHNRCPPVNHYQYSYPEYSYPEPPIRLPPPQASPDSVGCRSPSSTHSGSFRTALPSTSPSYPESLIHDEEYLAFEGNSLLVMTAKNGGSLLSSNPRMRRAVQSNSTDDAYRKQREKNNLAAKQSRDRRKVQEIRLALQVTYLKKKLVDLQMQSAAGVCRRCQGGREC